MHEGFEGLLDLHDLDLGLHDVDGITHVTIESPIGETMATSIPLGDYAEQLIDAQGGALATLSHNAIGNETVSTPSDEEVGHTAGDALYTASGHEMSHTSTDGFGHTTIVDPTGHEMAEVLPGPFDRTELLDPNGDVLAIVQKRFG